MFGISPFYILIDYNLNILFHIEDDFIKGEILNLKIPIVKKRIKIL